MDTATSSEADPLTTLLSAGGAVALQSNVFASISSTLVELRKGARGGGGEVGGGGVRHSVQPAQLAQPQRSVQGAIER